MYTVQLPWKTDSLMLPDNFLASKQRLTWLLKRLKQKPELLNEYKETIAKQEKQGIIVTVEDPAVTVSGKTYYIPHRENVRENRVTTKTSIVFDASTRRKSPLINHFVEAGRCLLPKVFEILLKCRAFKILLMNDIQSAFLNIHISEKDRDFLRFLWIADIDKENPKLIVKRFNSLYLSFNKFYFVFKYSHFKKLKLT